MAKDELFEGARAPRSGKTPVLRRGYSFLPEFGGKPLAREGVERVVPEGMRAIVWYDSLLNSYSVASTATERGRVTLFPGSKVWVVPLDWPLGFGRETAVSEDNEVPLESAVEPVGIR